MRSREEIEAQAKGANGVMPGIPSVTRMLALAVEILLDIRDEVTKKQ